MFGRQAGVAALQYAREKSSWRKEPAEEAVDLIASGEAGDSDVNPAFLISELQKLMDRYAGPLRHREGLQTALHEIASLKNAIGRRPPSSIGAFDMVRLDWFDLRNMLLVAECVVRAALSRQESRGAHQREDFPETEGRWALNQALSLTSGTVTCRNMNHAREIEISQT